MATLQPLFPGDSEIDTIDVFLTQVVDWLVVHNLERLALGCIEADFCNSILILQHCFPKDYNLGELMSNLCVACVRAGKAKPRVRARCRVFLLGPPWLLEVVLLSAALPGKP